MDAISELVYILLSPFGFDPYSCTALETVFMNGDIILHWWQLLNPNLLIPLLFYLSFGFGALYIMFILPFRYFKHIIKAPDKKGKIK